MYKSVEPEDGWETRFDGLRALDSLGKGILDVVGPLVNWIGSVGIKGIVPLKMRQSTQISEQKETDGRGDPS
jgi:hypothetical protein